MAGKKKTGKSKAPKATPATKTKKPAKSPNTGKANPLKAAISGKAGKPPKKSKTSKGGVVTTMGTVPKLSPLQCAVDAALPFQPIACVAISRSSFIISGYNGFAGPAPDLTKQVDFGSFMKEREALHADAINTLKKRIAVDPRRCRPVVRVNNYGERNVVAVLGIDLGPGNGNPVLILDAMENAFTTQLNADIQARRDYLNRLPTMVSPEAVRDAVAEGKSFAGPNGLNIEISIGAEDDGAFDIDGTENTNNNSEAQIYISRSVSLSKAATAYSTGSSITNLSRAIVVSNVPLAGIGIQFLNNTDEVNGEDILNAAELGYYM